MIGFNLSFSFIKPEISCGCFLPQSALETIAEKAHTGLPDDGKIYVSAVKGALCIRTEERGEQAV